MAFETALVFSRKLKSVSLESSGEAPIGGAALEAARQESFQAGFQSASDKCNAQILELRTQMQQHADGILKKIEGAYEALAGELAAALPELIVAGVHKILGEDASGVETLRARIDNAVAQSCPVGEPVSVRLAPQDLKALQEMDAQYCENHPRLSFKADETLKVGDCVMETKFGLVDARLRTQLRRLLEEVSVL